MSSGVGGVRSNAAPILIHIVIQRLATEAPPLSTILALVSCSHHVVIRRMIPSGFPDYSTFLAFENNWDVWFERV